VPRSWDILRTLVRRTTVQPLTFDVAVVSHTPPGYSGRTAFWRADGFVPDGRDGQWFTVTPVFDPSVPGDERTPATVDVRLISDAAWLSVDRSRAAFQGNQPRTIAVRFAPQRLRAPGVHVGRVAGIPMGQSVPVFHLTAVVVVPETLQHEGLPRGSWDDVVLEPGEVRRIFVAVPPGATAMDVRVRIPEGRDGKLWVDLYDPIGIPAGRHSGSADSDNDREHVIRVMGDELSPGTWELTLTGAHDAAQTSRGEVEVTFYGLQADPRVLTVLVGGGSEPATMDLHVVNRYAEPFEGRASGAIDCLFRETDEEADPEGWDMTFELDQARPRASFTFRMDLETYTQMTDVALRILDEDGRQVAAGSVDPRGGTVSISGAGKYTVELTPAHGAIDPEANIPFSLEQRYYVAEAALLSVVVQGSDGPLLPLYPGLVAPLTVQVEGLIPQAADGFTAAGQLVFTQDTDDSQWLEIPIHLE
jgi:hypothetical protein